MKTFIQYLQETSSLKINWALTKANAKDKYLYDDPELVIVYLNTDKVMKHGSDVAIKPDGRNAKASRLERLDNHIANNGYLDPPVIGDYNREGVINFGNGRHRFYWAWKNGIKKIPFFVMKSEKEYMQKKYG